MADARPTIRRLGPSARFIFCGDAAAASGAGASFGVALPLSAYGTASNGDRAALWLGPDEWLLVGPTGIAADVPATFASNLAGMPYSLVDVSARFAAFEASGAGAAEALNLGCPLDLAPAAFPVGSAARTLFGKAEIILWCTAPATFRLEVARSFAAYVLALLEEARQDAR